MCGREQGARQRKGTRTCAEGSDEFEVRQFEIAHWRQRQWLHHAVAMRHIGLRIRDTIASRLSNRRRRHGAGPVCGLSSVLWSAANSLHPQPATDLV